MAHLSFEEASGRIVARVRETLVTEGIDPARPKNHKERERLKEATLLALKEQPEEVRVAYLTGTSPLVRASGEDSGQQVDAKVKERVAKTGEGYATALAAVRRDHPALFSEYVQGASATVVACKEDESAGMDGAAAVDIAAKHFMEKESCGYQQALALVRRRLPEMWAAYSAGGRVKVTPSAIVAASERTLAAEAKKPVVTQHASSGTVRPNVISAGEFLDQEVKKFCEARPGTSYAEGLQAMRQLWPRLWRAYLEDGYITFELPAPATPTPSARPEGKKVVRMHETPDGQGRYREIVCCTDFAMSLKSAPPQPKANAVTPAPAPAPASGPGVRSYREWRRAR